MCLPGTQLDPKGTEVEVRWYHFTLAQDPD